MSSSQEKKSDSPENEPPQSAECQPEQGEQSAQTDPPAEPENQPSNEDQQAETTPPVEDLAVVVAVLQDQLLRAQAEMENVRKRTIREIENIRKFASEPLVVDLLPTIDSLAKARDSLDEYQAKNDPEANLAGGVGLCLNQLLDTLEKNGVKQLNPLGEPFNPNFHEAVAMLPNAQTEPNTILEVCEPGYTLNNRLIKAAKVVVSRSDK